MEIGQRVKIVDTAAATYRGRKGTIEYVKDHPTGAIIGVVLNRDYWVTQFNTDEIEVPAE